MSELPNELLSAYLDGELSADERAKVERMLASQPGARQLLDELRAISATVRSLPEAKLGEDLTGPVLQEAERRMLSEGQPEEPMRSPFAPVPIARAIAQRFFNRRTLAWLAVTAVIVVAISIYDRQQQARLGGRAPDAAIARRDVAANRVPALPEPAKVFEAAPTEVGKPLPLQKQSGGNKVAPAVGGAKISTVMTKELADRRLGVLVVRCDVTEAALESHSLDRLLDANGVVGHRQQQPTGPVLVAPEQSLPAKTGVGVSSGGPVADRVYVEATPSQLKAVLAGLAAQRELFLAVSTEPIQGQAAEYVTQQYRYLARNKPVSGPAAGQPKTWAAQEAEQRKPQAPATQRILFVLRVVKQPPVGAKTQ